MRIAGETAADKVGDTGMLGDAAGAPTCTEGGRRRDRDGGKHRAMAATTRRDDEAETTSRDGSAMTWWRRHGDDDARRRDGERGTPGLTTTIYRSCFCNVLSPQTLHVLQPSGAFKVAAGLSESPSLPSPRRCTLAAPSLPQPHIPSLTPSL